MTVLGSSPEINRVYIPRLPTRLCIFYRTHNSIIMRFVTIALSALTLLVTLTSCFGDGSGGSWGGYGGYPLQYGGYGSYGGYDMYGSGYGKGYGYDCYGKGYGKGYGGGYHGYGMKGKGSYPQQAVYYPYPVPIPPPPAALDNYGGSGDYTYLLLGALFLLPLLFNSNSG